MNGKKAKQLRRLAEAAGAPEETVYKTDKEAPPVWGSFPYIKNTEVIDGTKLKKAMSKTRNPKVVSLAVNAGMGTTKLRKYLRYIPGYPRKLGICTRMIYQGLKKKKLEESISG
jgi:methionine synthase I (cobalamin-dependent)